MRLCSLVLQPQVLHSAQRHRHHPSVWPQAFSTSLTHQSIRHEFDLPGVHILVYNYTCNHGGSTLWCAQSVGVAARTQHLHGRRQGKLFFPATSLASYIQYNKLYETLKHATTDQCYATCYGLRSPLADCDRSTRRAQAIGSLLGPAARLDFQRRINDPAEFPSACHAAWGSFVSVPCSPSALCSLCSSSCSVTG